jgi:hypothetical protein
VAAFFAIEFQSAGLAIIELITADGDFKTRCTGWLNPIASIGKTKKPLSEM